MSAVPDADKRGPPPTFIHQYPAFLQLQQLGVEDGAQLHAAFLVYMDLTEVRHWASVCCVKSSDPPLVLLEAREKEDGPIYTVLPLPTQRSLSHRSLRSVLDRGLPMLLCAVSSDSTLVYQRLKDGLEAPEPPGVPEQESGRRHHRKRRKQQ